MHQIQIEMRNARVAVIERSMQHEMFQTVASQIETDHLSRCDWGIRDLFSSENGLHSKTSYKGSKEAYLCRPPFFEKASKIRFWASTKVRIKPSLNEPVSGCKGKMVIKGSRVKTPEHFSSIWRIRSGGVVRRHASKNAAIKGRQDTLISSESAAGMAW